MGLNIGLVCDLRKDYLAQGFTEEQVAEFDSESTIEALEKAVRSLGHGVTRIGSARSLCRRLVAGERWDLVFNVAEGLYGRSREAQVPCILELYQIGYTFSDPLVCAATLDKAVAKRLVQSAGLRTPPFLVVRETADLEGFNLRFPVFAKPLAEGTGKGIDADSRIDSEKELKKACGALLDRYVQSVLVEEYLPGREFTTAVLGTGKRSRVLGTMEIRMRQQGDKGVYSYQMKERCEELVHYFPMAKGELRKEVETLALESYRVLECRDAARVDVRCDAEGRPSFLEVNPLPGLHPTHSDLPMIATQEGMSYAELIASIIRSAAERLGIRDES